MTGKELHYISKAHSNLKLAGDGEFTNLCHVWLEQKLGTKKALLTNSCTAALEMAALLIDIKIGDEIIMPSFTFVSTANSFVLRGAVPVFVDIKKNNLNIDESLIEKAITKKTKAIIVVHYAGLPCDMNRIMEIAKKYNLVVIEDAAQAILSKYNGRYLGTIGHFGCLSFHETKNIISGEGGALLINDENYIERAEIIREKGTNRSKFFRGQVDKYTWCDIGSSFLPGEITAAFLWAQLEEAKNITDRRKLLWITYHNNFLNTISNEAINNYSIEEIDQHNAHIYYLLLSNTEDRDKFIAYMKKNLINIVFHYVPLHSSHFGKKMGRADGDLSLTTDIASRLVRLPLWLGLEEKIDNVIKSVLSAQELKKLII